MTNAQLREADSSFMEISHSYNEPIQAFKVEKKEIEEDEADDDDEEDDKDTHRSWSPVIKSRRRFSTEEILFLEEEFVKDINPSSDYLQTIAEKLGTTRRVITTWFQNHRAKGKRAINNTTSYKRTLSNDNVRYHQQQREDQFETIDSSPAHHICMNLSEFEHYPASYASDQVMPTHHHHHPHPIHYSHHDNMQSSTLSITSSCTVSDWGASTWNSSTAPWINWPPSYQQSHPTLPQCCLVELYTGSPCPFHSIYPV